MLGGVYGIIHDQLTYTISPEYYTRFKFYQFGFVDYGMEAHFENPRIPVSAVGFLATWWMGIPIGIIMALVGLRHKEAKQMFSISLKAIAIILLVAFAVGLIGLAVGKLYLADKGVSWYIPENLIDPKNFIAVGSMHNFSYIGGLFGLIAGVVYSIKQKN